LILKTNLPFADEDILNYVVDFLQTAHEMDERYSVRDGINIARYALKRLVESGEKLSQNSRTDRVMGYMKDAAFMILDSDAARIFEEGMDDGEQD
jgi:hypothetical protein